MEEKKFTLAEIERAILQCPPHKVHIDTRLSVDDGFVGDIETIETKFFLFRLFKSNRDEFSNYDKMKNEAEKIDTGVLPCVTNRTFKCLGCKFYAIKVTNDKGGTTKICNVKQNDIRAIVDLDAPNCIDYAYGW